MVVKIIVGSVFFFITSVLLIQAVPHNVRSKRQAWIWEEDFEKNYNNPSSTTKVVLSTTSRTTSSRAPVAVASNLGNVDNDFAECFKRCPKLPQYNPVCGTNKITYLNESFMTCAQGCGLSVDKLFNGNCRPRPHLKKTTPQPGNNVT